MQAPSRPPRSRYQGVAQIVSYNRRQYLIAAGAICTLSLAVFWFRPLLRIAGILFILGAAYWVFASLGVSHWVYDRSSLYSLNWLMIRPRLWLNVHAGLDEFTEILSNRFPSSEYEVFDVYDSREMTEPSIAMARKMSGGAYSKAVPWRRLPCADGVFDAIFLMFVAHEFRREESRHIFFRELARALAPGGRLIMAEHIRDVPNFLAFGPGFLHFQARQTWRTAFREANLAIVKEIAITPFVKAFELKAFT